MSMQDVEGGNNQYSVDGDADVNSIYGHEYDVEFLNAWGVFKKIGKAAKAVGTGVKNAAKFTAKTAGKAAKGAVKVVKKVAQKAKTAAFSPMRGAMEGLIRLNAWGIATDLKKRKDAAAANGGKNAAAVAQWEKIKTVWLKFGGNRNNFSAAVDVGAKKKALKLSFRKKKGADGTTEYFGFDGQTGEYLNVTGVELVAAAAPIVVAILGAMGKKPEELDPTDIETGAALGSESAELGSAVQETMANLEKSGELQKVADAEAKGLTTAATDIVMEEVQETVTDPATGKQTVVTKQVAVTKSKMPTWGWVVIGVGSAAVLTGIVTMIACKK